MLLDTVKPPDEVTLADVAGEMSTDFDGDGESEAVLGGNSSTSSLPMVCSTGFSATVLSSWNFNQIRSRKNLLKAKYDLHHQPANSSDANISYNVDY